MANFYSGDPRHDAQVDEQLDARSAATTWVCSPHGTRVEQEESPTFDCPEADRAGCYWTKVESAATNH
jgi:hypothetical protein